MKKTSNILWGIVLVILGIIFGLNALEITNINIFFEGWWTLFIIIPSFIDLFKEKDKTGNLIALTIGIILFLACRDLISFRIIWKLAFPIALVLIGLSIIFKDVLSNKIKKEMDQVKNKEGKEYCSIFSSQSLNFANEDFKGCELSSVFGSIDLDLRNSKIKDDTIINTSVIFGNITIYVPENINIKIVSNSIFGSTEDKRKTKSKDNKTTLYIKTLCIFGGVDLK